MNDHFVLWIVLAACCCGALIAVGLAEYAVWLAAQQERGH